MIQFEFEFAFSAILHDLGVNESTSGVWKPLLLGVAGRTPSFRTYPRKRTKVTKRENRHANYLKNPWTLQWKGLNLYSRGVWVLKIATFEGSGFLG